MAGSHRFSTEDRFRNNRLVNAYGRKHVFGAVILIQVPKVPIQKDDKGGGIDASYLNIMIEARMEHGESKEFVEIVQKCFNQILTFKKGSQQDLKAVFNFRQKH